jgi:hypothetical protein
LRLLFYGIADYFVAVAGADASAGAEAAGAAAGALVVVSAGVVAAAAGASVAAGAAAAGAEVSAGVVAAGGVVVVDDAGASSFLPHAANTTASKDAINRVFFMEFPQKLLSRLRLMD